jgi:hypothetical protein
MPSYSSKSQSKSGGRRKKQTKRKLRRGRKSRKVMRGGDDVSLRKAIYESPAAVELLNTNGLNPTNVTIAQIEGDASLKSQLRFKGGVNIADHKDM